VKYVAGPSNTAKANIKHILPTVKARANLAGAKRTIGSPTTNANIKNTKDNPPNTKNPVIRFVLDISGQILSHLYY
jgi:hypothetical protein